jgi:uncharacterized protein (TIGR02271 family)
MKHPEQAGNAQDTNAPETIPVIDEEVEVSKRVVDTGGVRVSKTVSEREATIDEPLVRHDVVIERVPVDRLLPAGSAVPSIRQEGDTLIIPLVEEIVVMEKRLRLKEEVHVRRVAQRVQENRRVTLRSEHATVEKID